MLVAHFKRHNLVSSFISISLGFLFTHLIIFLFRSIRYSFVTEQVAPIRETPFKFVSPHSRGDSDFIESSKTQRWYDYDDDHLSEYYSLNLLNII